MHVCTKHTKTLTSIVELANIDKDLKTSFPLRLHTCMCIHTLLSILFCKHMATAMFYHKHGLETGAYKPNPVHHLLWNKVLLEQMHDHLITYCLLTGFMLQWYSCYQSQAQLLAARKLVGETMVVGTEKLLLKSCWNLERRLD